MTRSRVVMMTVSRDPHSMGDGPLGSGKPMAKKANVANAIAA